MIPLATIPACTFTLFSISIQIQLAPQQWVIGPTVIMTPMWMYCSHHWGSRWPIAFASQCCAPVSPGSIPGPGTVCATGFQSILASAGFSLGTPFFLLYQKLIFSNISIPGNIVWSWHRLGADMAVYFDALTFVERYVACYKNRNLFIYSQFWNHHSEQSI